MIEIWEPRYRDRVVLVAASKVKEPLVFRITKGKYQGTYTVDHSTICQAKHEKMLTKSGGTIEMVCLPLDEIRRIDGED